MGSWLKYNGLEELLFGDRWNIQINITIHEMKTSKWKYGKIAIKHFHKWQKANMYTHTYNAIYGQKWASRRLQSLATQLPVHTCNKGNIKTPRYWPYGKKPPAIDAVVPWETDQQQRNVFSEYYDEYEKIIWSPVTGPQCTNYKARPYIVYSFNPLAPVRSGCHFKTAIFNLVLLIGIFTSSMNNALRWMPRDLTDDKSTLVQVMAWYREATSHYLSQCWPSSMSPHGVTRPQWIKATGQALDQRITKHIYFVVRICVSSRNFQMR